MRLKNHYAHIVLLLYIKIHWFHGRNMHARCRPIVTSEKNFFTFHDVLLFGLQIFKLNKQFLAVAKKILYPRISTSPEQWWNNTAVVKQHNSGETTQQWWNNTTVVKQHSSGETTQQWWNSTAIVKQHSSGETTQQWWNNIAVVKQHSSGEAIARLNTTISWWVIKG